MWVDTTVDVTYDFNNGGANPNKNVEVDTSVSSSHSILSPSALTSINETYFKGWMFPDPAGKYWWASDTVDNGYVSVVQPGQSLPISGNLTLYAKWDYYVHYNDGTGFTHDVVRDGDGYVVDAPLHTPSGKEFKSWKGEDANGNIAYYKVGDTIDLTTDLTLTATWSDGSAAESYVTVSYDANGGRGSIADDEVIAGGKVTLDDGESLSRNGYEFVGWAEEPNAVYRDYGGGARITVEEDITLYAVWKAVSDETTATVTMSADKEIYEPGDTIIITVLADNTDHFYIDADSAGFNVLRQDGSTIHTGGVFVEKNAPTLMYPSNRYENGEEYEVELYIPQNCSDGIYSVSVRATDSILNEAGDGNIDGEAAKVAEYSITIVVEDGYEDKVTVNINKSKITLHIDDVDTLQATITPTTAKRDLEWYSSNEGIVTVTERSNQKGRIVATGYGTATITADVNGVKDTCTVVVERCTYDQKDVSSEFLKTPATCSSYAIYYKSCECGYHGSSTFAYSEGGYADHTYSNKWSTNEDSHWHAATCEHADERKDFGSHVYDNATDVSCNTCGYTRTVEHIHTWGPVNYTWAEDGSSCTAQRVCTKDSSHKETATATISSTVKIPATETVEGTTSYTATFTESWASKQTKDIQDIPVTSHVHDWGTTTYTWAADGSSCTAQRVCTKDSSHKETATATITSAVKIPATEMVEGTTTYTATFTESWAATQTKDVRDIPVSTHVHDWGTVSYTWAEDGSSCTAQRVCTKNSSHKETATATITSAVKIPATEMVEGTTTYTATFTENWAAQQTKDIQDIPVTGSNDNEDFWYWYLMMIYSQEFNISASANAGGTISPEGISKVKYDKNITYIITPDEGYAIADVLVDGKSVGAVSEYTIKRVKKAHTITAVFEEIEWKNPFTDVSEEAWYYEDVEFVYENDLMIGTDNDVFSPNAIVNRAMLVTVLWRLEGSPIIDSHVDFVDVPANEWYTDAVNWASANGIVNGYGDGTFGANKDLTHEQVMAILNRYAVYKKWSENVTGNVDDSYINSGWADNNVLWADLNGMFKGIGSDITDLTTSATRAELAAYLRRFCENIMK
ncbi:MAG: S-layer homology domain-containing protein [Clostridia bacterium]|nr:S-layer homology domain-containing protein [Clostridia bacterium]